MYNLYMRARECTRELIEYLNKKGIDRKNIQFICQSSNNEPNFT